HRYTSANTLQEAAELITKSACEIYEIASARVWNLNGQILEPIAGFSRETGDYHVASPIDASQYPSYLEALHNSRSIDTQDIAHDPRTREIAQHSMPSDTTALLDASIRIDGQVVGVLCLEQKGTPRPWQADEIAFAGELADHFAQV